MSEKSSEHYQKQLTQIARNIHRTLDLNTVWQQTVDGLGKALKVSRCLICPYQNSSQSVQVSAEYRQASCRSLLRVELQVDSEPYLSQALATLEPVVVEKTQTSDFDQLSTLAIATCYQDKPNALIILHECVQGSTASSKEVHPRQWSSAELDLVRELADQVGTAIAHATLFAESQALATELQRVNNNLMQKHQELEEARQLAEAASRLKSEFLTTISHELRTPLNAMIGFLRLILEGMVDDPEEQSEFIDEAHNSAVHLLSIINDILNAKLQASKIKLELSPVNLNELLNDVERFTRNQAQQKNLNFEILKSAIRDEIILYANYQKLLLVMLNLVGNAIKFTPEGGITISTKVIKKKVIIQNQELPGMVEVQVADTGIGVPLEKHYKLFQSFSKVDGSYTTPYGGTGLGLAISQNFVEAMGGEVNFYSMGEGLGSTVTFTVPLYQDPVMVSRPQMTNTIDMRLIP